MISENKAYLSKSDSYADVQHNFHIRRCSCRL